MKGYCPLASGSKGNCTYIGSGNTKLLIDVGISAKALIGKLSEINVDIGDIDAICITHEHTDHIQGLKTLASKYAIPVFSNHETAKATVEILGICPKFKIFTTGEPFEFGDFEIHSFSIQHDAMDPVAFTLKTGSLKLGICTDLGYVSSLVQHELQACDYLHLEANHEPSRVHASSRPDIYKRRVLSRSGHLSNQECGELLSHVYHTHLKSVHLAHLSSECNSPETAHTVINDILERHGITLEMHTAFQERVSKPVFF